MNFFELHELKEPELQRPLKERVGLQIRVELSDSEPKIWRSLEIPSDLYLDEFHMVLQGVMGWEHSHLHSFNIGGRDFKNFAAEYEIAVGDFVDHLLPQESHRVDQLIQKPGDQLLYLYDYGDGWEHQVVVEKVLEEAPPRPRCLAGENACPPEDCGGVCRANELAAWVRSGHDPQEAPEDPARIRKWLADWSPDSFTPRAANEHLELMQSMHIRLAPELVKIIVSLPAGYGEDIQDAVKKAIWHEKVPVPELSLAQLRPFLVLLDLIGEGKKLTTAKYLPPMVVKEWTTQVGVNTGILSGGREIDSPLQVVREYARELGLLHVDNGIIKPTKKASELGEDGHKWARHIASRLPLGKSNFERHAGFASLVAAGSGANAEVWDELTRDYLGDMGWRGAHGRLDYIFNSTQTLLKLLMEGPAETFLPDQQVMDNARRIASLARSVVKAS